MRTSTYICLDECVHYYNFEFELGTKLVYDKKNSCGRSRYCWHCSLLLVGQGNNLALVGAYILAGELKAAEGNYKYAFNHYHELLRSFVEANQELGAWVSKSFLVPDEVSKEVAEQRTNEILQKVQTISNAIMLPEYK